MSYSYVLCGSAGSYSDWHMWVVATYTSAEEAEAVMNRLNSTLDGLRAQLKNVTDIYHTKIPKTEIDLNPDNRSNFEYWWDIRDRHNYEISKVPQF